MASSAGRLFDAVAAALGVCRDSASYEGQAAIELEALAREQFQHQEDSVYEFSYQNGSIDWNPLWIGLLEDLVNKVEPSIIAARFHHTIAAAVTLVAESLCIKHDIKTVVLSGGVYQNKLLLEQTSRLLRDCNLILLSPQMLPANDGGISLGQAAVAMALHKTI